MRAITARSTVSDGPAADRTAEDSAATAIPLGPLAMSRAARATTAREARSVRMVRWALLSIEKRQQKCEVRRDGDMATDQRAELYSPWRGCGANVTERFQFPPARRRSASACARSARRVS